MFFEIFVYSLLSVLLVVYSFHTYQKAKKPFVLAILSLQIIATIGQLASLFVEREEVHFSIRFFIFMFGTLIPSLLFFAEYVHINIYEIVNIKLGNYWAKKENYEKAIHWYQKA